MAGAEKAFNKCLIIELLISQGVEQRQSLTSSPIFPSLVFNYITDMKHKLLECDKNI